MRGLMLPLSLFLTCVCSFGNSFPFLAVEVDGTKRVYMNGMQYGVSQKGATTVMISLYPQQELLSGLSY